MYNKLMSKMHYVNHLNVGLKIWKCRIVGIKDEDLGLALQNYEIQVADVNIKVAEKDKNDVTYNYM